MKLALVTVCEVAAMASTAPKFNSHVSPTRVRAEVVDVDTVSATDGSAGRLEKEIHDLLFA